MDCNTKDQFVPHSMHIPYTSDGLGTYSAETLGHAKAISKAIPLVLEAIKSSDIKTGSGFNIVDYGAADGGTSMPLIYESVKAIREKYGEEMPITIIYEDQPVNDFKSLFMRSQDLIPGTRSYLMDFENVFVMACGTDFYSQCFPSNTVHLGFSATSAHWLREKPCDIVQGLVHRLSTDQKEKEMFSKQAENDWELFLVKRAKELAKGSYLILAQLASDAQGQWTGHTQCTKISFHKQICSLWEELVQKGRITQEEFKRTTFAMYYRTEEELKKPFKDPDSSVRRNGLELVSIETHVLTCPLKERWLREKGDPKQHAKRFISSIRTWSYATMLSGLSDLRSSEEKAEIVDELYHRYESLVAKTPEDHGVDFVTCYIVIRKRQ